MTVTVLCAAADSACSPLGDSFEVVHAPTVAAARDRLSGVDCVVSDYALPDGTALDLFETVRETVPDTPCVLWTDLSTDIPTEPGGPVVEAVDRAAGPAHLADVVRGAVERRSHAAYPLPDDEPARLAAVDACDVDGLGADRALARLTRLTARHVGVPLAFLTLLGAHEERVLSCHGTDLDRIDRQDTVCTHAILGETPLVVEDLEGDPRFTEVSWYRELDVRSYMGMGVAGPGGYPIGTLCVCDRHPRAFTDDARAALQLFAEEVTEQLELRRWLRERGAPADGLAALPRD
jgi:CheY-like chemotaxis protein